MHATYDSHRNIPRLPTCEDERVWAHSNVYLAESMLGPRSKIPVGYAYTISTAEPYPGPCIVLLADRVRGGLGTCLAGIVSR